MIKKEIEKNKAIKLRKMGKTYSEILKDVTVAKSTLSIWLKEVKLANRQIQRITTKKLKSAQKGGDTRRKQRLFRQNNIWLSARSEIKSISQKELFHIGTVLYWAEGSKEKESRPGSLFEFSNMDPRMIQVIILWLQKICKIDKNMIIFNIFLHETHSHRLEEVRKYWAKVTGFPIANFLTVYWKRNKLKTNRKNVNEKYFGLLKIKVKQSSSLVRQIKGWSDGIFEKVVND